MINAGLAGLAGIFIGFTLHLLLSRYFWSGDEFPKKKASIAYVIVKTDMSLCEIALQSSETSNHLALSAARRQLARNKPAVREAVQYLDSLDSNGESIREKINEYRDELGVDRIEP